MIKQCLKNVLQFFTMRLKHKKHWSQDLKCVETYILYLLDYFSIYFDVILILK
jgi:hypothetical protein